MGDSQLHKPCVAKVEENLQSADYDGIVLISHLPPGQQPAPFGAVLADAAKIDESLINVGGVFGVNLPSKRFVYAPTGNICPDYDDVRSFADAAKKGVSRALKAGIKSPLLVIPTCEQFKQVELVTVLGALEELYVPIMVREDAPKKLVKPKTLGVYLENKTRASSTVKLANAIEAGRFVARDIGGGDPERMAPPRVEKYVLDVFGGSGIKIEVLAGTEFFEKEYPLFAAVNRAASVIERHQGRIIYLTYEPQDLKNVKETLMFVGKGVTYDTGGADIKAGGIMAGMSRDKCGAAGVAGFMKVVAELKPQHVKVVAALCMVRNSVGENCYVSDEVVIARSGVRVRVGNTDAEGRMAMADALCRMKELASTTPNCPNPHLFTIATLTGHAVLAVGNYSICQDNGPAREDQNSRKLQDAGAVIGDPFEISTMRREDIAFYKAKSAGDDLLQCTNTPSSRTPRGHQSPGAFLLLASGLEKHGLTAKLPVKYSHLDIAASAGDLPHEPSGAPIAALVARFIQELN
ncbi:putative aminopeptidase W07G4.4 isoform X2 [Thrips palmi]|uniref:Aminopeptidase W07G4.4 isoform X2 n=1 Tax=Thrips palmi TaxID=161013 RepID=A0A6P9AA11_THRPL|nr:putative aminopeptidase W07G4.4 isoform X2 [Thrips palmi]